MPEFVKISAPAKLNLTLNIKGVMPNGYHIMDMIMQSVSLYENVIITKHDCIQLLLSSSELKPDENNTAYKAAKLFFSETNINAGAKIAIDKNTPICAGMAGGSADAAAVLVGLNALYKTQLSQQKLCEMGANIGADVPFCIVGGTAHVTGFGEKIKKIAPCPHCYFVVCMPNEGISTKKAFDNFDKNGEHINIDTQKAIEAIENGNLNELCAYMKNVLQICSQSHHNDFICQKLKENGAKTALMTGSGAAVFGVFNSEKAAIAAKQKISEFYDKVWILTPVSNGVQIISHQIF